MYLLLRLPWISPDTDFIEVIDDDEWDKDDTWMKDVSMILKRIHVYQLTLLMSKMSISLKLWYQLVISKYHARNSLTN